MLNISYIHLLSISADASVTFVTCVVVSAEQQIEPTARECECGLRTQSALELSSPSLHCAHYYYRRGEKSLRVDRCGRTNTEHM